MLLLLVAAAVVVVVAVASSDEQDESDRIATATSQFVGRPRFIPFLVLSNSANDSFLSWVVQ